MTIVSNTQLTYSAVGIRESLSDTIYQISPEETPFISNIGKGSVPQTYNEWQNDALGSVDTANAQLEGDDVATFPAQVPTTRLGNYQQISRKLAIVSGTYEGVKKAGRSSEMAYQLAQRAAELKRDIESIAVQNQAAVAGNSTTARKTAGFEAFLRTNTSRGASGANPTLSGSTQGYPNAVPTDGTQRAFTETILKTVAQSIWTAGGTLKLLMVGALQKQVASGFAGIAQQRRETGDGAATIIGAADVYVSDFGAIQIVPNRFIRNRSALFVDPERVQIDFYRPFQTIALAQTGDAQKRMILAEWGLRVTHEAAHGIAADLT
jgi:hypothetical protein